MVVYWVAEIFCILLAVTKALRPKPGSWCSPTKQLYFSYVSYGDVQLCCLGAQRQQCNIWFPGAWRWPRELRRCLIMKSLVQSLTYKEAIHGKGPRLKDDSGAVKNAQHVNNVSVDDNSPHARSPFFPLMNIILCLRVRLDFGESDQSVFTWHERNKSCLPNTAHMTARRAFSFPL